MAAFTLLGPTPMAGPVHHPGGLNSVMQHELDWYEDDEPVADVLAAFERGPHGVTTRPSGSALGPAGSTYFTLTVITEAARAPMSRSLREGPQTQPGAVPVPVP